MNKVLVTGGLGLIGSTVSERLLKEKKEVVIVDNLVRKTAEKNRQRVSGAKILIKDIYDLRTSSKELEDVDAIIHCAANPGIPVSLKYPVYDFKTNALGTLHLLEIARKKDLSFLYCSTNKVYPKELVDEKSEDPMYQSEWTGFKLTDDIAGGTHSPYGCSKLAGDLYCSEYFNTYGVQTVINRMSCIYGPHQYGTEEQGWIAHFIFAALKKEVLNIFGNGEQRRDCLWSEDLAELFSLQLEKISEFKGTKWNVGGGVKNIMSLHECIILIEGLHECQMHLKYHPARIADHQIYVSDITPLEKWWTPKTRIVEGVTRLYEWALKQ